MSKTYKIDLTGEIIGSYKIIEFIPNEDRHTYWKVQCIKCGDIMIKRKDYLNKNLIHKCKIKECDKEKIVNLYINDKKTAQEIAKIFDLSQSTIIRILQKLEIDRRHSVYKINNNFFEVIDTEEKAYWLGFLYADGTILRKGEYLIGFQLELSEKDKSHLMKFKDSINSTHPISNRIRNINGSNVNMNSLNVGNVKIANDLVKLGCVPNKSLILTYPTTNQVPQKLQSHFIRGIFDGDGCLGYSNMLNRYNNIVILGTFDILINIKNYLNLSTYSRIYKNKNIHNFTISNKEGVYEFYDKIYKNANIYLDRKYEKFQLFLNYYKGVH